MSNVPAVRKAVFPAAGLGTRFLPATRAVPKEMLPLVDRPLIQYAVEEVRDAGLTDVVLVTATGKTAMEDHFDRSRELEARLAEDGKQELLDELRRISALTSLSYVRQKEALGLGHAVLVSRPLVGDEPFAVVLCDDVIRADVSATRQLLDVYDETGGSVICVEQVDPARTSSYGIVAGELVDGMNGRVLKMTGVVEKPAPADAPSDLRIIGRYVLTPRIFGKLETTQRGAGGEIQLTDAIQALLEDEPVYAMKLDGTCYDAGSKLGFLQATVELALAREDLGNAFREYLRGLDL